MARKKPQKSNQPPVEFSARKRQTFRLLVVCFPLVLVVALEAVLRVFGLGGYMPMLERVAEVQGGTLIVADQGGASSWFFASPTQSGRNEQYAFLDPKPTNTVRIFFVGASAIEGYPQPRHLASSAFLQVMLQDAWPERTVEVINLGATAIASFPVLGIMSEALDYDPDLIVVHTGHNEFFGTYGVASAGRGGSHPWMLQATRLMQSLALMQGLNMLLHPDEEHTNRTLMESMMGNQHIGPEAWQRGAAARNLYHNVSRMIQRCQKANVPVIVCTQPTNEKDIAPIGGERLDHLSSEDRNEVESLLYEAEALAPNDPPAAEKRLRTALEYAPSDGRMHYLLGKTLMQQQEIDAASDAFRTARDLDSMPWRAPTLSQESVLRAATDHDSQICDLTEAFRSESVNGLIGWELMDDHVHPNLRGQALTAEALMGCLTNFDGALNVSREAVENRSSWEHYAQLLGENVFDRYAAAHSMRILFAAPFMRENNQGAFERYDAIARRIELQMPVSVRDAMTEWQETQAYAGSRCPVTAAVAQVLLKEDDYAQALDLYEIALKAVPDYTSWHLEYMYYSMFCRERLNGDLTRNDLVRIHAAIEQGTVLCDQVESSLGFNERFTGFLHLLCGEYGKAIPFLLDSRNTSTGIDRLAVEQALFLCFLENRRFDEARQLVLEGAARKDEFALRYQSLLDALPELMEAVGNPE